MKVLMHISKELLTAMQLASACLNSDIFLELRVPEASKIVTMHCVAYIVQCRDDVFEFHAEISGKPLPSNVSLDQRGKAMEKGAISPK